MDYDQTEEEMGQVFLRAHDVYHIFVQSIYRRLVDLNVNDPLYEEKYKELFDNDSNIEIEE